MFPRTTFVPALCLAFAVAAGAAPPASEHHDHAAHAVPPRQAPAGRWATDAPLREGMRRVTTALGELRHHEMGHMTNEQARERAVAIEEAVRFLFANCHLAPEPDAALHSILVPLLSAAKRLDADPADKAAVAAMREAVAPYATWFDDSQAPAAAATELARGGYGH